MPGVAMCLPLRSFSSRMSARSARAMMTPPSMLVVWPCPLRISVANTPLSAFWLRTSV